MTMPPEQKKEGILSMTLTTEQRRFTESIAEIARRQIAPLS